MNESSRVSIAECSEVTNNDRKIPISTETSSKEDVESSVSATSPKFKTEDFEDGIQSCGHKLKQVLLFTLISLAATFNFGFSTTYLNTPVQDFKEYLNESYQRKDEEFTEDIYESVWNVILNVWFVGFFLASTITFVNDRYGRKVGFIIGSLAGVTASILRYLAIVLYEPNLFILGRFLMSYGAGVNYQTGIAYLQECAPTRKRGVFTHLSEIVFASMCTTGSILGSRNVFGSRLDLLMGFTVPVCAFLLIAVVFLPETPKFILLVKKNREKAEKSVIFYQGSHASPERVLQAIDLEAHEEDVGPSLFQALKEILATAYLRKAVFLGICALQNTVGMWALLFSSTYFLTNSNVPTEIAQYCSSAMTAGYVIGATSGTLLIEKLGRRGMFLTCATIADCWLLLFITCSLLQPYFDVVKYGCLMSLVLYGLTFGNGVGPIPWFISSELVPQRYRSLCQSLCYSVNTLIVLIFTFTMLPLYHTIGAYAFLILYAIPNALCIWYMFIHLPETKGREIHEIVAELRGE